VSFFRRGTSGAGKELETSGRDQKKKTTPNILKKTWGKGFPKATRMSGRGEGSEKHSVPRKSCAVAHSRLYTGVGKSAQYLDSEGLATLEDLCTNKPTEVGFL